MALKSVITAAEYEKLADPIKAEYKKEGDGYVVDLLGLEDHPQAGALKRAKDRVKEELKEAQDELKKVQDTNKTELDKLNKQIKDLEARGDKGADIEKLRGEYEQKLKDAEEAGKTAVETYKGHVNTLLVDNVAKDLAGQWSTVPGLLAPQLKSRLTVEYTSDGKPETRILDKNGQISAMSMDDLKAEVYGNKEYEPILKANGASGASGPNGGGGDNGGNGGGSAPNGGDPNDPTKLSNSALAERVGARLGKTGAT